MPDWSPTTKNWIVNCLAADFEKQALITEKQSSNLNFCKKAYNHFQWYESSSWFKSWKKSHLLQRVNWAELIYLLKEKKKKKKKKTLQNRKILRNLLLVCCQSVSQSANCKEWGKKCTCQSVSQSVRRSDSLVLPLLSVPSSSSCSSSSSSSGKHTQALPASGTT